MGYSHDCRHATSTPCINSAVLLYWCKWIAVPEIFVTKNKVMAPDIDLVKGLEIRRNTVKRS